jgi:hypothetical protein
MTSLPAQSSSEMPRPCCNEPFHPFPLAIDHPPSSWHFLAVNGDTRSRKALSPVTPLLSDNKESFLPIKLLDQYSSRMPHLKQILGHFKIAWYGLLAILILLMLVLSAANSTSIATVSIKLREGQREHKDKAIPFITDKGDELPDYRVSYLLGDRWHSIGTAFNQSAVDWIEFQISDPPNLTLVQCIRVSDEDAAEDDHLEEVQLADLQPKGKMFEYRIETTRSFKSGLAWFATTALGIVIFGAIGLAVFLVVLSHLAPAFG